MFSRGSRTQGRHARDDRARRGRPRPPAGAAAADAAAADPAAIADGIGAAGAAGADDEMGAGQPAGAPPDQLAGPYDSSQAPAGGRRLDLGSLKILSVPGVEVRVQANPEGVVQQVYLLHGDSLLQLGVFAAPRSESLWDEVRAEIRQSLFTDGVAAQEVAGDYGTELRARVRTPQGLKDLRFVGVSGPRWLLRAVYQGPAAVDPAKAEPLAECLRGLVVDRGSEARPAKEPLPLRLSEELAAQLQGRATGGQSAAGQGAAGAAAAAAVVAPADSRAASGVNGNAPAGRRKPSPRPRRD